VHDPIADAPADHDPCRGKQRAHDEHERDELRRGLAAFLHTDR
jgi:hypothetical protein